MTGLILTADPTGKRPARLVGPVGHPVTSLAVHDGAVYAGTLAGRVRRCDTGREANLGVPAAALCPTTDAILAATSDGTVVALDMTTLELRGRATIGQAPVQSLAPFRGGFLTVSEDRTVAVGGLRQRTTLWEHGNRVSAAAALGDRVIASASADRSIHVVRLTDDGPYVERRQSLPGLDEPVKAIAVLGDDAAPVVVAATHDSAIHVWRVDWRAGGSGPPAGRPILRLGQRLCCLTAIGDRRLAVVGADGDVAICELGNDRGMHLLATFNVSDLAARAALLRQTAEV